MQAPQKNRFYPFLFVFILSISTVLVAGIYLLALPFDGIEFNGDSFVYFSNAKAFSKALAIPALPRPAYWPYGYPALLSMAFAAGDISYESARWVNVIAGGCLTITLCSLILVFARWRKLPQHQVVLLLLSTGLWPLAHGYFLKYQLSMMSDMSAALWGALIILACWRWRVSGNWFAVILAGAALGMAVFTRYIYVLMIVPALVALLTDTNLYSWADIKKIMGVLLLFGTTALLVFSPQLFITLQDLSSSLNNGLFQSWSMKNFFALSYQSTDGYQSASIPSVLYYGLLPFQWKCFTPFGLLLSLLGLKYAIREVPRWMWLSVVAWYGIMYVLLCGIPIQNARIAFPLFLPVLIFVALGTLECFIVWERHARKLFVCMALLWCISLYFTFTFIAESVKNKNKFETMGNAVARAIPEPARVISTSLCAVYLAYPIPNIEPYSIHLISVSQIQKMVADKRPLYLAIDEEQFVKQWSAYSSYKNYAWIRSHCACRLISKAGAFNVYEVKPL
ncbi:MAG: dolichyl-phosphate-mannose-protein mannosyltransferase [Chitinophagaceae bacterium]|nr:dolichyl-phosphate-mannose-protein mannosyltransferase [Chitinophagaceae bacterium]